MSNLIFELTDKNFDETVSQETPILVDFWAPWCGPCLMLAPVIDEVARSYAGRLRVGKLNVDENPHTASRYGVQSIPTLALIHQGKIITHTVGALSKSALTASLDKALHEPVGV